MLADILTVFWRDWIVLKHRLMKFIFSRMVTPVLYMIAFGWGLARNIRPDASGTYLDFIVPGILALNSMNIAYNSLTPVCTERVYHKSMEEYLTAPIHPVAFVIGKTLAAVLRGMISSVIIILLAYLFGAKLSVSPLFAAVLVINCAVFAEIGFCAAMCVDSFEDLARVNTYLLLPMSFLCGTFFNTDRLPPLICEFIELLPLTQTSTMLRSLSAEGSFAGFNLTVLLLYLAVLFVLCLHMLKREIN